MTTPFDMTVLNRPDRFHMVMDAIERPPALASRAAYLKQKLQDKLIEHRCYICEHGMDLPEVREWTWGSPTAGILR